MSDVELSLGSVTFRRLEVPSKINFGGRQRVAVHRLANGERVVDVLGNDEADIRFSGTFTGPDAVQRAIEIDALRTLGSMLPLTWGVLSYRVIIKEFSAEFQSESWIPYSIACTVCANDLFELAGAAIDLIASPISDLLAAVEAGSISGVDAGPALGAVENANIAGPGSRAYQTTLSSLTAVDAKFDARILSIEQLATVASLTGSPSTHRIVQSIRTASNMSESLWATTVGRGLVGRARSSLLDSSY